MRCMTSSDNESDSETALDAETASAPATALGPDVTRETDSRGVRTTSFRETASACLSPWTGFSATTLFSARIRAAAENSYVSTGSAGVA